MNIVVKSKSGYARKATAVHEANGIVTDIWKAGEWWRITDPVVVREFRRANRDGMASVGRFWSRVRGIDPVTIAESTKAPSLN